MKKIITLQKIGYNKPRNANWSYGVWQLSFIDREKGTVTTELCRDKFGGNERLKAKYPEIIVLPSIYTDTGTQNITGIKSMEDIESDSINHRVREFLAYNM